MGRLGIGAVLMARTRTSARKAGSRFERVIADYLASTVDDRIDRRTKTGAKDRGDIGGIRLSPALRGGRVVAEVKDCARIALAAWHREADVERGNDDAVVGVVIHKRHGVGWPGDQWVTMTVDDLVALLTGERPGEPIETADSHRPASPLPDEKQTGVPSHRNDASEPHRRNQGGAA